MEEAVVEIFGTLLSLSTAQRTAAILREEYESGNNDPNIADGLSRAGYLEIEDEMPYDPEALIAYARDQRMRTGVAYLMMLEANIEATLRVLHPEQAPATFQLGQLAEFDYDQSFDGNLETIDSSWDRPEYRQVGPMILSNDEAKNEALQYFVDRGDPFRLLVLSAEDKAPAGAWVWQPGMEEAAFEERWENDPITPPPYPTCRFFSPPAQVVNDLHASLAATYRFNRPYDRYARCDCPTLNAQGQNVCSFQPYQPACEFYEPELVKILRHIRCDTEELIAQSRRVGQGVNWFQLIRIDSDGVHSEEITRANVASDARSKLLQSFEEEMDKLAKRTGKEPEEIEHLPARNSYLKKVLTHAN